MIGYALRRCLAALVVMAGAGTVTFGLMWLAPGNPAATLAFARFGGEGVSDPAVLAAITAELGLERGFLRAFGDWALGVLQLDLGRSFVSGRPVVTEFATALGHTLPLAGLVIAMALALAVPMALLAARRPGGWVDQGLVALASLGAAVPSFWLGLMLIVAFSVGLGWLPAFGTGSRAHLILPAATLAVGLLASLMRILRAGLISARQAAFVGALRIRGVHAPERAALHLAPHAAIPFVTMVGLELAFLIEGTVIVEVIFARPGVGSFLVEAVRARDFPRIQVFVLFSALLFVTINLCVDLICAAIDPRLRRTAT